MTFWQENFSFIKDVYDSRSSKLIELMDKTEKAMSSVLADKIYTSNEFKKIKETFIGLARNLEQPETKEWLTVTKDTLMNDRGGNEQDEESKKLGALLTRFDDIMPKVNDTKNVVDCLWKAYQFTDELAPYMEWFEDMRSKSSREINTDSASQTEEHIEKQEKYMDQMDKKKKSVLDQTAKGEKILADPKSPKFLEGHVNKLKSLWLESNKAAEERLAGLKENLRNWEKYEKQRDSLDEKLQEAKNEYSAILRQYDETMNQGDYLEKAKLAEDTKTKIVDMSNGMKEANSVLCLLMSELKKQELAKEITIYEDRIKIKEQTKERLDELKQFNEDLKKFSTALKDMEEWNLNGRTRMDDLLKPGTSLLPEERVMYTMELQSDIEQQLTKHEELGKDWQKLKPQKEAESSSFSEELCQRLQDVEKFLTALLNEVKAEGEKFGEDIKYLADFTSGQKKFEPWIENAEAKKKAGMIKPSNLQEALNCLQQAKDWSAEADKMNKILEEAHQAASKMTVHDDPDAKHKANMDRWTVINQEANEWISKYQSMVDVWEKQAATAAKVTAAIAANPSEEKNEDMNLEDLEKHLETLKQAFIEKKKMMDQMGQK